MDLTTLARVKAYKPEKTADTDAARDAFLELAIDALSTRFERAIDRPMLETSRTQLFDVDGLSGQVYRLNAYPVASVASVKNDPDRDFDAASLVDTDSYYFDVATGLLEVDGTVLSRGSRALQVVYTGGLAANTTAFVAAYPDIAMVIEEMALFLWEERLRLGQLSVQGPDGAVTLYEKAAWLPNAKLVIEQYRRRL